MQTAPCNLRLLRLACAALLCLACLATQAGEILGKVVAVEGASVRISVPRGSDIQPGDSVSFRTRVPDIGLVSLAGEWRVQGLGYRYILAQAVGRVSGLPKPGYEAVIRPGTAHAVAPPRAAQDRPRQQPREAEDLPWRQQPQQRRPVQDLSGYPPGSTPIPDDSLPWLAPRRSTPPPPPRSTAYPPAQRQEPVPRRERPRRQAAAPAPQPVPTGARARLRRRLSSSYSLIWKDTGSGADRDFASYRAPASGDFRPLGDVAIAGRWESRQGNPHTPTFETVLVGPGRLALATPRGYEQVWNDSGSGARWDYSLWRPVAPDGYACLGQVGTRHHQPPPSVNAIRCVPLECVEAANIGRKIWDSGGSGAKRGFSAWDAGYANLLVGNGGSKVQRPSTATYRVKEACFQE